MIFLGQGKKARGTIGSPPSNDGLAPQRESISLTACHCNPSKIVSRYDILASGAIKNKTSLLSSAKQN